MPKGPQGQKRPADVIGNAVRVMQIATGEAEEEFEDDGLTDFCLISLRSSRQNRCPDFQPICRELHAPAPFAKRALGRARGLCEGIAGTCRQGLCGARGFGFGRFGRSSETPGTQPPEAGRLEGDIGAIPCETQGGSMRAFLPDRRRASFRNPGFGLEGMLCAAPNGVPVWQRAALRQVWQVWQDRRFV